MSASNTPEHTPEPIEQPALKPIMHPDELTKYIYQLMAKIEETHTLTNATARGALYTIIHRIDGSEKIGG